MYVFPGIGLAASVAGVREITDTMLYAASVACVDSMTEEEVASGRTFPAINRIRDVSHAVACSVIRVALEAGLTTKVKTTDLKAPGDLESLVRRKMCKPRRRRPRRLAPHARSPCTILPLHALACAHWGGSWGAHCQWHCPLRESITALTCDYARVVHPQIIPSTYRSSTRRTRESGHFTARLL